MKIMKKEILAESAGTRIVRMKVASPDIARKARPGQFVALMVTSPGERIPLTIVERDTVRGTITLVFQEVGLTTRLLGKLEEGDSLYALVGPLGHATEIEKYGRVILVGGGVGVAEIYPVAKALKEEGNHVTTIIGARNKELLILESDLRAVSDEIYVVTDDGSYGKKAFTTDMLEELLGKAKYDLVYAVGPIPMMKKAAAVAQKFSVRVIVSLNALMVDATGMCGCCRVSVGGKTLFSCVDGPEFDGQLVGWDELEKRSRVYSDKEKHICNLDIVWKKNR